MSEFNDLLDRLLMLKMGNGGNTRAHIALENIARRKQTDSHDFEIWEMDRREYLVRPNEAIYVFDDHSAIYKHEGSFFTILTQDFRKEQNDFVQQLPSSSGISTFVIQTSHVMPYRGDIYEFVEWYRKYAFRRGRVQTTPGELGVRKILFENVDDFVLAKVAFHSGD